MVIGANSVEAAGMGLPQKTADEGRGDSRLLCDHLLRDVLEIVSLVEHPRSRRHRVDRLLNGRIGLALPDALFRISVGRGTTVSYVIDKEASLSFCPSHMIHRLVSYHAYKVVRRRDDVRPERRGNQLKQNILHDVLSHGRASCDPPSDSQKLGPKDQGGLDGLVGRRF